MAWTWLMLVPELERQFLKPEMGCFFFYYYVSGGGEREILCCDAAGLLTMRSKIGTEFVSHLRFFFGGSE
jgi:hypothetical protein